MVSEAFLESVWKMHEDGKKIVQIALETGKERHAISRYIKIYDKKINSQIEKNSANDLAGFKNQNKSLDSNENNLIKQKALLILADTGLDLDTLRLLNNYFALDRNIGKQKW